MRGGEIGVGKLLFEFECGWGELDNEEMIKEDEQENMEEI
jgi:hypothetical protein